jgi:PAS domain S-box-containing protein
MVFPSSASIRSELARLLAPVPLKVGPSDSVLEAIVQMVSLRPASNGVSSESASVQQHQSDCVLVCEGERFIGVVTERDVLRLSRSGQNLREMAIAQLITTPVPTLDTVAFVDALVPLTVLEQHHVTHLPLVNHQGSVVGMLTPNSLLVALNTIDLLQDFVVADVMLKTVLQAPPTTTLLELAQLMSAHDTSYVLIGDERDQISGMSTLEASRLNTGSHSLIPSGIVTQTDILQALAMELDLSTVQAHTRIRNIVSVGPQTSLASAQQLMLTESIDPLVVATDDGRIVGLVTPSILLDILHPATFYRLARQTVQQHPRMLEEQVAYNQLLTQMSSCIHASPSLQEILDAAVNGVRSLLQCDRTLVHQFQPDWSGLIVAESVGEGWPRACGNRLENACFTGQTALLYRKGRMIAVDNVDAASYSDCYLQLLKQYEVRAKLVVPILVSGQLWGLLIGHQCSHYRSWKAVDLQRLNEIGIQLAIAIQQATTRQQLQAELQAHQQSEIELRQQREFLRTIIDTTSNKIFIKDWEGRFLLVNRAIAEAYHTSVSHLVGKNSHDFIPDSSFAQQIQRENQTIIEHQQSLFIKEEQSLSLNGQEQWFQWQKHPITVPGSSIQAVLGIGIDITQQKEDATVLHQYERVVSATTDGVALLNRHYVYQLVNHIYLEWHQKTREEIVGHSVAELLSETVFQTLVKPRLDSCLAGEIQQYEAWFDYKNGGQRFVRITYAPYFEVDGVINGVVVTTHDLTSIKLAETRLELQNTTLEQIAKAEPLPDILDTLLRRMEAELPDSLCSVMLCDSKGKLHCESAPSLPLDYLQAIDEIPIGEGIGSCGTAAYRQEAVFVSDIETDPLWRNYRSLALEHHLRACWSVPFFGGDGRLLGVFCIYFRQIRSPCPQDLESVNHAANLAGIAIEREKVRRALEQLNRDLEQLVEERTLALNESENRCEFALQGTNDGIWDWDITTNQVFYSNRWKAMRGFAEEEGGKRIEERTEAIHPDDYERVMSLLNVHLAGQSEFFEAEYRVRCKDGSYLWVLDRGKALRDTSGRLVRMIGSETDITQRKLTEVALQKSEQRYYAVMDGASDAILLADAHGNLIEVNRKAEELLGYTRDELVNLNITQIHPTEALQSVYQHFSRIILHNQGDSFETLVLCKDGTTIPVEITGSRIDLNGELVAQGIFRDIRDRKATELALQQSESRYRAIVQDQTELIARFLADTTLLFVNDAYCRYFGLEQEAAIGRSYILTIYEADRNKVAQILQSMSIDNPTVILESRVVVGGEIRWMQWVNRMLFDDHGNFAEFQSVGRDITQLKQIEDDLRQSEERFRNAFNNTAVGMSLIAPEGRFLEVNTVLCNCLKFSAAEMLTLTYQDISHPDDLAVDIALAQQMLAGEVDSYHLEKRLFTKHGEVVWGLLSVSLVRDRDGQPLYFVSQMQDISDRKLAEAQLRDVSKRLEMALGAAAIGIWEWDVVTDHLYWDDRMLGIYGVSREEFTGHYEDWQQRVHPDDLASQYQNEQQALNGERNGDAEFRIIRPDGTIRIISAASQIQRDGQGKPIRVIGLNIDITDRHQAAIENQSLKERLQFVLSSSPAVLFTCRADTDYGATFISDNILRVTGYTPEEFLSESSFWADHLHPEDAPVVFAALPQLFAQEHHVHEYRFRHRDGHYLWIRDELRLVRDEQGTPVEVVGYFVDIGDRKRAEAALRQSEERLRLAVDAAQMATWDVDLTTGKAIWTERHFTMLGYEPTPTGEASEEMWIDRIHPNDIDRVIQEWQQSRQAHRSYQIEYRVIRADNGEVAWLAAFGNFSYNYQDQAVRSVGVLFDITHRRQAEQENQQLKERLQFVLSASPVVIFTCKSEGDFGATFISSNITVLTGYTPEEFLGESQFWATHIHPEDATQVFANLPQLFERRHHVHEYRFRHKAGHYLWIRSELRLVYDAEGNPIEIAGDFADISDRKRLEEVQQRLITILEASTDYIGIFDVSSSRVIWTNAAIKQLRGIASDADVSQTSPADYYPQWVIEILERRGVPAAIATGSWLGETALIDAEGKEVPVSQLLLAHKFQDEVAFFSTIMRDIRVHKEYENLLERTNAELRRATRMKDEFFTNMSHELRTPLTAILGMSDVLMEEVFGDLNPRQCQYVEVIHSSGEHLLKLINDILDISKISAGKLELNITTESIVELCQSSLEFVKQQAQQKDIQLSMTLSPNLETIDVDQRRICQVLINLLSNAVKFTPNGGQVTLDVQIQERGARTPASTLEATASPCSDIQEQQKVPDSACWILMSVIDTGIGISADAQTRLFKPFEQIDSSLNRQYEGTGLGLALVKQIVELHGGFVTLQSELGQGSCFTIGLPYRVSKGEMPSSLQIQTPIVLHPASISDADTAESLTHRQPLILLAEDNQANIDTISDYLEVKGYRLIVARDGREAIDLAQAHHPDLILMDIQMPGMDGLEAIQAIRREPQMARIPIVALTALAMAGDRERCLEAGADDYCAKPVKLKQLVVTIQQLLAIH